MMLPSPPKTFGRLGDVLISAYQAVLGQNNPLKLSSRRSVCVIVVDGLGFANLTQSKGYARFLNSQVVEKVSCFFPATTSTSLTSLATGLKPVETKFIGYQIFDRNENTPMNLLSGWVSSQAGQDFQPNPTVSELAVNDGIDFHVISHPDYEKTGLTAATMRSTSFHGFKDIEKRFNVAKNLLKDKKQHLIYLYVPELDQIAHKEGWNSESWSNRLEQLDSWVSNLVKDIPSSAGVILTADHGIIDIGKENHIYLDELLPTAVFDYVGGDTRGLFLYLKDRASTQEIRSMLEQSLSENCYVVAAEDLVQAGYWNDMPPEQLSPDLVLLARKEVALYHRGFAKAKSLLMVGHHGSISDQELSIPIIRFNL